LRLVKAELPISFFERSRLGPRGRIVGLQEANGIQLRNTLHNRIVADAFVPCGGRPNAINAKNWKEFLQSNGAATSKVIVEGANLFLTPEARAQLSDCGVLIFKDSSANKCGVICSSFEIGASMLLSEEQFLKIKERFVQQVLVKLRELARREAELLARVRAHRPQVPLPEVSTRISRVMIRTSDAIEGSIDHLKPDDAQLMQRLVVEHLPQVLLQTVGEQLWTRMPRPYLRWIMAKSLAARMVYREGFEYLETMPLAAIADLGIHYLRSELERSRLVEEVSQSALPDKQRIAELLGEAGILTTLE
jgi:glutamate dehydrogenase